MIATNKEFDLPQLQKTLASRVFLIFLLPYIIAGVLVVVVFVVLARVKDVEIAVKLVNIERVWANNKNYAWAIDQYSRLAKQTNRAEILVRLGALSFGLDPENPRNETVAIETLARAKALDPEYWETYSTLTHIYLKKGKEKAARDEGEAAVRLNPFDAQTYNNLAWLYATSADPEIRDLRKAEKYAKTAVDLTRETQSQYLDTLAEVYFRAGELDRATEYIRKAIAISPNGPAAAFQEHLERFTKAKS